MIRGAELPYRINVEEIVASIKVDFSKFSSNDVYGESHDFPEIIYVYEGDHFLMVDGTVYDVREGEMMIFAPFSYHGKAYEGRKSYAKSINFSFRSSSNDIKRLYNRVISLSEFEKALITDLAEKTAYCFDRVPTDTNRHVLAAKEGVSVYALEEIKKETELFFASVLKNVGVETVNYSDDFKRVSRFLKDNLDKSFTLSEIARANSIGVTKLKTLFEGGVVNYHLQLKVEKGKVMLRENELTITEIAERLGFESIHYFSRFFKSRVGASPREYRQNIDNIIYLSEE